MYEYACHEGNYGMADLDTNGDGAADEGAALTALSITDDERARLAQLYASGQALWRVPITHFTPWDGNWPPVPPGAAVPLQPPPKPSHNDDDCSSNGSIINIQNQALGQALNVTGAPMQLRYNSELVPGRAASLTIPLSGSLPPPNLKRIELQVDIGGKTTKATFGPEPNKSFEFVWDGKDAYGRTLQGAQPIEITIAYVYPSAYSAPNETIIRAFMARKGKSAPDRSAQRSIKMAMLNSAPP